MKTSIPELGAKSVFDVLGFRRSIENAIGRGIAIEAIAARLETSPESVERWRRGEKLPHPHYCDAVTAVVDHM